MKTVRAILLATVLLVLPIPFVDWVVTQVAALDSIDSISLPMRLAMAASNWYARFFPPFAVIVLVGIAVVGLVSERTSVNSKRSALVAWVLIAAAASVLDVGFLWLPVDFGVLAAGHIVILIMVLGGVALVAALVLAAQIQGAVSRTTSTRVRGWHIVFCGAVLLFLGPLALLTPIFVLVTSRRSVGPERLA